MNCWKTIRVTRDYGSLRLMMYSGTTMLLSFLFYYLVVSTVIPTNELTNISFFALITSIISIVYIHKCLHLLPIWLCGKKATIKVHWLYIIPILSIKTTKPLPRNLYLLALLTPIFIMTSIGALAITVFPMYLALISILSSIHFGIAFYDVIYASYLIKAPKKSFVEDHDEGFHILIKQQAM
ncbi:DUF3267 domain-containing protein [Halalkalibacter krulwichiae]|uniref:Zincin peptidase n=1 Tax=Halalkalibacter krulwichiae TaxID=199441 RepID=A0A1X9M6X5_9BACI|nr:DUF3267 domain-containing protein [Halalkalibacter krulwichiae]ARK29167.1 hypothetical protein BkAM31D_04455 [Halalkalibacter krulwichiae]